jgi:hypothetical protein
MDARSRATLVGFERDVCGLHNVEPSVSTTAFHTEIRHQPRRNRWWQFKARGGDWEDDRDWRSLSIDVLYK